MPLHRVRAHMRFTRNSGLATWCRDQMEVRYQQAVHINEGDPSEEEPVNEVEDMGGNREEFRCDLPLTDEAAATDAVATLSDPTVLGQSEPLDYPEAPPSWVEHHTCDHREDPAERTGCGTVERNEGPE